MDELEYQIGKLRHKYKRHFMVCVDAALKIEYKPDGLKNGIELEDSRADYLDYIATKYDIPLLTTHEMRKRQATEKSIPPTMEDTKGSGRYGYNAKFGALVYPHDRELWKNNKSSALIFNVDKNKIMERTGKIYMVFERAFNHIKEMTDGTIASIATAQEDQRSGKQGG
jgi:hypothetical protein